MLRDLDLRLLRLARTRGHEPRVEEAVGALAATGEWGALWTAGALWAAAFDPRQRRRWLVAATVPGLTIGANYAVKRATRRSRPVLARLPALGRAPSALSFPSAHATSSFAAATAMGRVAPPARPLLFGLAATMAASRPYLGMHYPSDVLAGAALGVALGAAVPLPRPLPEPAPPPPV